MASSAPFTIRCDFHQLPARTSGRPVGRCHATLTAPFDQLHEHAAAEGWLLNGLRQFCLRHQVATSR